MRFLKLKELCEFEKGSTGLAKAEPGDYPLVTTGAERKSCNTYQFDTKAVCIPLVSSTGHGHASLKNVHYQEGKFALGSILVALTSKDDSRLDIQFLHLYLSQLKDQVLVPLMSGAANVALSIKKIQNIEIPLPSIGRQREIVERFKSIVAEEDELKSELTHQQTLLKKLRQQILQEAIEGKLTADWRAQNPDVEPASELLKRIATEKAQLVKDKKIKAPKPLPPITDEEKPFELPQGWEWCRLGEVFNFIDYRGKTPRKLSSGVRLITARNVKFGALSLEPEDFISQEEYDDRMTRGFPKFGDLLFTTEAPLGNVCLLTIENENISTGQRLITLQLYQQDGSNKLFMLFMLSPFYQSYLLKNATGVTAKGIKAARLRELVIPVPSSEEQQAVVTKVERLLVLCDQLETQITQNQTHAEQLMQAVLKEAFSHNSEAGTAATTPRARAAGGADA
ncbi:restriction endonuclease subunit S [Marinobacter salarius]|uniref:Type-1 restriction enzyme EcoKI specificity protein n=1 Tax=Marinobacter salarius TaxID=1420917 RepID=A0A1W6K531_9GAMM|nr:restriction endonuclease subunit S [Marinobacter salarius]ARM82439.1 type-1 restriction enzyme EcoKI specificity protein [Marinobacter salarius]